MSKVSSDYWFIYDESPDKYSVWDNWLNDFKQMADGIVNMPYKPIQLAPVVVNQQTFNTLKKTVRKPDMDRLFTVFTDEIRPANDPPGTDTHDDLGRPLLDASGGPARPTRVCPRHGQPMTHGRCPKCS